VARTNHVGRERLEHLRQDLLHLCGLRRELVNVAQQSRHAPVAHRRRPPQGQSILGQHLDSLRARVERDTSETVAAVGIYLTHARTLAGSAPGRSERASAHPLETKLLANLVGEGG